MRIDIDVRSSKIKSSENITAVIAQIRDFITNDMRLKIKKVAEYSDRDKLHTFIIADEF